MATMAARRPAAPAAAQAILRHYRCSPQKARLVVDQVRGKNVNTALALLRNSPKGASRAIEKLLRSAAANAERSTERVDVDTLYVSEAYVGPGPTFKRFRGRAFGRAFQILHRTCHITLKLSAKGAVAAESIAAPAPAAEPEAGSHVESAAEPKKSTKKKPAARAKRGAAGRTKKARTRN